MNPLLEYLEKREGRFLTKWDHYFDIYHKWFSPFRDRPIKLLEIGVFKGGSIDLWKNYFAPGLQIIGVDIDPQCKKFEETYPPLSADMPHLVKMFIGDQENKEFLAEVVKEGPFDIVIDDGGHYMKQQIASFETLFPFVKDGGVYLIEDVHSSYLKKYTEGEPQTFTQYLGTKVDELHGYYEQGKKTTFTETMNGIHFYDSVVVIEKVIKREQPKMVLAGKIPDEFIPKVDTRRWKDTLTDKDTLK